MGSASTLALDRERIKRFNPPTGVTTAPPAAVGAMSPAGNMAIQRCLTDPAVQRACDCGASAAEGQCEACSMDAVSGPVLQRKDGDAPKPQQPQQQTPAPIAPGLGATISQTVAGLITAGKFQEAVDAVVAKKAADGAINTSLLAGNKMLFSPTTTSDDATTSMPSWDSINNRADPATVKVGPSAFTSGVPYLYSVIMHEYQHVLFQQTKANQEISHTAHEQGLGSPDEVRAGSWEIMHAEESGLDKMPDKIAQIWNNLNASFWKMASNDQTPEKPMVTRAFQKAQALTRGKNVQLDPFTQP
jgi:hypothetical protein